MGKGDARRPAEVTDEVFEDRWEKVFKKVPAPPRERPEPHNAGSESFGGRANDDTPPDHALLLGDGWSEIKPRSDHLPGGAFVDKRYEWAVYFCYESEGLSTMSRRPPIWKLAGEFEKNDTANKVARLLRLKGATTRVERILHE